ncbi:sulfate adenylyltransferase subunit 1 [Wenyingzhuangia aestuarii]|uniref:sulfate adenylyltransferase subunit 1 n=1 Tax=Wenyingzhuangia aestuarii TaxID=1647582 RepID=UPI00143BAD6F|nr:GTP-binding protein [Wenyingzhuangia aestuarii]NJB83171.1 sulfate adenylyltransferase subunit 1 [Wenyingzhuangia aestuarii]
MEVLKIATAGSVDDGKSTLIGRILYDTRSLTDDKLEAIERTSKQKGFDYLDFSLATDGLVAEREQGITIDVAHIYFSTAKKSYIIADTPGHVEYTRNMVTGASTSQAAIILVDARNGVIEQTYRHFFINNLLKVKDIIVAVNKMDLVDFAQDKFEAIKTEITALAERAGSTQNITFIPVSALQGDNVVDRSTKTPWYTGTTLLEHFEKLEAQDVYEESVARLPVQTVIRPKTDDFHDFRGYAGKLYGGSLAVGDEVTVLPSKTSSKIKDIYFFDKKYSVAERGTSINVTLENDINISRGDIIVKASELPQETKQLNAKVCWMDATNLVVGKKYFIQQGANVIAAKVASIDAVIATDFSGETPATELKINEIGKVSFKLAKTLFYDTYAVNKTTGSFVLIDPQTNNTSGAGFIQ